MATLDVCLFGKLFAQHNGQMIECLRASKVRELFCYLLLYRDRPQNRESLATLLWSNNSTAQSKKYLRQALWQLQAGLESKIQKRDGCLFLVEPDWVQLNSQADLKLDVAIFEQALALVNRAQDEELDDVQMRTVQEAVDLYKGDLLEGWYQDWCLYERERLQNAYLFMLDKMMGYCESKRLYEDGLRYGELILRLDHAQERTHQRIMRLYYRAGHRAAALRQYERCVAALADDLGVKPSQRTVELCEQIRADQLADEPSALLRQMSIARTDSPLHALLPRLKQLEENLVALERQLQQDIQTLESDLRNRM